MSAKYRFIATNTVTPGAAPSAMPIAGQRLRVVVSGYVGWGDDETFTELVDKALAQGCTGIDLLIHSKGGSVFDGLEIARQTARFEDSVAYVGTLCASIATPIAAACKRVVCGPNTFFMIHKPTVYALITSLEEAENAGIQWEMCRDGIKSVYAQRMGLSDAALDDLLSGADKWISATKAKEMGLVDEIAATCAHSDMPAIELEAEDDDENYPEITLVMPDYVEAALGKTPRYCVKGNRGNGGGSANNRRPAEGLPARNTPANLPLNAEKGGVNDKNPQPFLPMEKTQQADFEAKNAAATAAMNASVRALAKIKGQDPEQWVNLATNSTKPEEVVKALENMPDPKAAVETPATPVVETPAPAATATAVTVADTNRLTNTIANLLAGNGGAAAPTAKSFTEQFAETPKALADLAQKDWPAFASLYKGQFGQEPTKKDVSEMFGISV